MIILFINIIGPPPIKLLRNALEAGDEERAIEIYMTANVDQKTGAVGDVTKIYLFLLMQRHQHVKHEYFMLGPSLMDEMNPSTPFPSKKSNGQIIFQTPLHLAARMSLYRIFTLFLEQGGNPNAPNGRGETCLHCVCQGNDRALVRKELMEFMLNWERTWNYYDIIFIVNLNILIFLSLHMEY